MTEILDDIEPRPDTRIAPAVLALRKSGVETYESCEGGPGHAYPEPMIRFHGGEAEGYRALSIALVNGLSVRGLRRAWDVHGSELTGPWWEMTFAINQGPVNSPT